MNRQEMGLYATAMTAAVVVGWVAYSIAEAQYRPRIVEVAETACGVPPSVARFGVPLQTLGALAPNVPVRYGPLAASDAGAALLLAFDPAVDGRRRGLVMAGDTLHLPTTFGHDARSPERITLICRDGALASVQYRDGSQHAQTYTILREAADATTD